ncbi:MAG TPA: ABC transporter substrate-binding protein [Candidatus Dormibacteraeota bacterium]|jgi:osmoprotectant transport system substrate-binding protein|nr:ABC transporter substrate-binding protein [Candidatus Dormibacteraeota bacterium]
MYGIARRAVLAAVLGLSLVVGACGSSGGGAPSKGRITIGAQSFSENATLAYIYGGVLKDNGYTVGYRLNLGTRAVVAPALERGDISLYPGYTASDLEFYDQKKGLATQSAQTNARLLNTYLPRGLKALTPSPAADENAFVVTGETAARYHLTKVSDLKPIADQLVFGGPPDCPGRSDCLAGLERTYGLHFKAFRALDLGGPATVAALQHGDIQVALLFSTDGTIAANHWTVLQDDQHIVAADDVIPIVRTSAVDAQAQRLLDQVSARLTTADLTAMNAQTDVAKRDPQDVAADWLRRHGYKAG